MPDQKRAYIAIDLKSFYASVECMDRNLDPLDTHLVVADPSRTSKTICLAVSPSLKAYGIPGRARLFEVEQRVKEVNRSRTSGKRKANSPEDSGRSISAKELALHPDLAIDFITAPPRMRRYMKASTDIYRIYLNYVAPEDIHVYSIDEVFIDATAYLHTYRMTAGELAMTMIRDVLKNTGITATAGIGTNLYLAKIAMDIEAKHIPADENGVRIAELNEESYRRKLWTHEPLTDFWRVGRGIAAKLQQNGIFTMGDVARCSLGGPHDLHNEDLLFRLLGINAELLIDHAWGFEPVTLAEIKAYRPATTSMNSGQVLARPYSLHEARLVIREMIDQLSLELFSRGLVTDQITLTVGYDIENLQDPERRRLYKGPVVTDRYGRKIPKHAHGTIHTEHTSSTRLLTEKTMELYDRIMNPQLLVRRMYLSAEHLIPESELPETRYEQLDLFTDYAALEQEEKKAAAAREREKRMQKALVGLKDRFGKNAVLKGSSLLDSATARERNETVGGHKG